MSCVFLINLFRSGKKSLTYFKFTMKIPLPQNFQVNIRRFLQHNGYSSHLQMKTDRLSFIKRITSDDYPRFHIYIEKDITGKNYLTLHLDQKKPSYNSGHAHMGEYSSDIVAQEARNLQKSIFQSFEIIKQNDEIKTTKSNFFKRIFHI